MRTASELLQRIGVKGGSLSFVLCASRRCLDAGGCPAAGYFILLAQNISNQTKGHPPAPALRASLVFPKRSGGCGTPAARSDSPRRRPPIFTENRGGAEGDLGLVGVARVLDTLPAGEGWVGRFCVVLGPLGPPPSSTAGPGAFGEDCLRPQAEFRSRPFRRAAQGTRSEAKGGG
jgi:hypothetical protein